MKYQLPIAQQSFTGPRILPLKWMPLVTQVILTMCKELGARTAKLTLLLVKIMKLSNFCYINNLSKVQTVNLYQTFIVNN